VGNIRYLRHLILVALASLTLFAAALPALAADSIEFPPDVVCPGFGVRWDTDFDVDLYHEVANKRGDVLHGISFQRGEMILTNLTTGESISEYLDGAVFHDRYYADGTGRSTLVGEFVAALLPTDTPPGPSTRLYNGRLTYTVDADGNWTVESFRGTSVDLCAALAN
jgi:hypothetical protein